MIQGSTYHAEGSVGKNVVQLIEEGAIDLILNTPNSRGSRSDGYAIRSAAIAADLPQFTTMTEFSAVDRKSTRLNSSHSK